MPFVLKEKREKLDKVYQAMLDAQIQADGDLNYILYKFAKYQITEGYGNYKNYMAELNECAEQIRDDFLVPYEKRKKLENGDV